MIKRRLFRSISSLTLLKLLDYIFPLLIIPIAIKSIGIDYYGITSYFLSISLFCLILTDFGFNIYGVQRLASSITVSKAKRFILASFIIRGGIFVFIVIPINFLLIKLSPESMSINGYEVLFLLIPFFNIFNLQWFFQAKEKYSFIILVSLIFRAASLAITFIFVLEESDIDIYVFVLILIYGAPFLLHWLYFVLKFNGIVSKKLDRRYIVVLLKINVGIFRYRLANAIILPCFNYLFGFSMSSAEFGVMSLVQRIFGAIINFSSPITQALIPHLSVLKKNDLYKYDLMCYKSLKYTLLISILMSVMAIILTYLIVYSKFLGDEIIINDIFPHILIMFAVIPHVLNSLQSQILILNNQQNIISHVVYTSLLIAFILCITGLYFNVPVCGFILFYLFVYYFMAMCMFLGRKKT